MGNARNIFLHIPLPVEAPSSGYVVQYGRGYELLSSCLFHIATFFTFSHYKKI